MPIKDKTRYPKNWKEIRDRILDRAYNRCEKCGLSNYEIIKRGRDGSIEGPSIQERGMMLAKMVHGGYSYSQSIKIHGYIQVILTIHHKDFKPENCEESNLIALCQRCHNIADSEYRTKNRKRTLAIKKLGKASELFF